MGITTKGQALLNKLFPGLTVTKNDYSDSEKASVSLLASQAVNQLIPCTGRLAMPQNPPLSSASPTITYRSYHNVLKPTSYIQLVWVNQNFNGATTNPFTFTASVQAIPTSATNVASVATKQVTFNGGATSIVVGANQLIFSDPIWAPLLPTNGAYYYVKSCPSSVVSSNNWPLTSTGGNLGEGQTTGDQTMNSSATFTSTTQMFKPSLILTPNVGKRQSWLGIGNSIMDGSNDSLVGRGFFGMFLDSNNLSGNKIAVAGERLGTVLASNYWNQRYRLALYATHAIVEYPINDLINGDSLATVQANAIAFWYILYSQGIRVCQTTTTPRTTSTDFWQTVAGQTKTSFESTRIAWNNWLRAGAPCTVSGYTVTAVAVGTPGAVPCPYLYRTLDLASVLEVNSSNVLTQDGGFWLVGNTIRSGSVSSATSTSLSDTSASFNSLPVGGALVKIVSGTGSGQVNWCVGNPNNTQINLLNSWATTPDATSQYAVIDIGTRDGLHMSTNFHGYMRDYLTIQLPSF